jgi:hypothetical protein
LNFSSGHFRRFVRKNSFEPRELSSYTSDHFGNDMSMEATHMTDTQPYPGTPLWVKVFGMIAFMAVVLFAALHLLGGGVEHLIDHGVSGRGTVPMVSR